MNATPTIDTGTGPGTVLCLTKSTTRSERPAGSWLDAAPVPTTGEVRASGYRSTIHRDRANVSGTLTRTPDRSRSRATIAAGHEQAWLHVALAYLRARPAAAPAGGPPIRFRV